MNEERPATRVRIWDLPVRLFHWLLAATFLGAFAIATLGGDEGPLFGVHAVLGLIAAFLVLLRIVWGVAGSRWARFGSLDLRPASLGRYLAGALGRRGARKCAGHNPATSWFLLGTIALVAGLAVTGISMARGSEAAEEVHEVLAWSMLALAGLHVAGVAWHRVRRGENLAAGMVTGWKDAEPAAAIVSTRRWSAAAMLLLTGVWAATLAAGYDGARRSLRLPLLGELRIGEVEQNDQSEEGLPPQQRGDEDHDDDD